MLFHNPNSREVPVNLATPSKVRPSPRIVGSLHLVSSTLQICLSNDASLQLSHRPGKPHRLWIINQTLISTQRKELPLWSKQWTTKRKPHQVLTTSTLWIILWSRTSKLTRVSPSKNLSLWEQKALWTQGQLNNSTQFKTKVQGTKIFSKQGVSQQHDHLPPSLDSRFKGRTSRARLHMNGRIFLELLSKQTPKRLAASPRNNSISVAYSVESIIWAAMN